MRNAFNIELVQSPLNQAYQYAFTGNVSEAMSELQIASSELDSLIINLTRAGQQMAAISENKSLVADNSTGQMMVGLGDAFCWRIRYLCHYSCSFLLHEYSILSISYV
jgi:hypothetical protein